MTGQVFVSRPGLLSNVQSDSYRRWLGWATASGLTLRCLPRSAYERDPWHQLREILGSVDGALIFGFQQLQVSSGTWRRDTSEERRGHAFWTSPWTQVEAGMAIMVGVPVLILSDPGLEDGVLSPQTWTELVIGVPMDGEPDLPEVQAWLRLTEARGRTRAHDSNP